MNGNGKGKCKKDPGLEGKFKGIVSSNVDPLNQGRLLVEVPDILGEGISIWAESASPLAGKQMGMYFVPPVKSGVWVEFLSGDPDRPVWTGCWRGSRAEVPADAMTAPQATPPIIIQSEAQNKIIISSTPGEGIILETAARELGPRIVIDKTGITISTSVTGASIKLQGNSVNINNNALTIV